MTARDRPAREHEHEGERAGGMDVRDGVVDGDASSWEKQWVRDVGLHLKSLDGVLESLELRGTVRPADGNVTCEAHRPSDERDAKDLDLGDLKLEI